MERASKDPTQEALFKYNGDSEAKTIMDQFLKLISTIIFDPDTVSSWAVLSG